MRMLALSFMLLGPESHKRRSAWISIQIMDRGAAKVGVVGCQPAVRPRQVQHPSDLAHAVIARDDVIQAERIEQLPLIVSRPIIASPRCRVASGAVNHGSRLTATNFHNKICQQLALRSRAAEAMVRAGLVLRIKVA